MQATEMVAGRELDALVAEKVMGLRVSRSTATHLVAGYDDPEGWGDSDSVWAPVPAYSTEIGDAWQAVAHMHHEFGLVRDPNSFILTINADGMWYCEFPLPTWMEGEAASAPLAICRAALAAVTAQA